MADVVIVLGSKRGGEVVPVAELVQMCGRAGRKHGGLTAMAYILTDEDDFQDVEEGVNDSGKFKVMSSMVTVNSVLFHLLPEICSGSVKSVEDAKSWYDRTLGHMQGSSPDFADVMRRLELYEAVKSDSEGYVASGLGKIASSLYFHPADIYAWRNNFTELFRMGLENDDAAVAWALGNVPEKRVRGDFGKHRFVTELMREAMPADITIEGGTVVTITLWWGVLGGPPVGRMRNQMLALRDDSGRILRALKRLDEDVMKWNRRAFFEDLEFRIHKRIPNYLTDLCRWKGITKGRAEYLYEMGAKDREGVRKIMGSLDEDELGEDFMNAVRRIVE